MNIQTSKSISGTVTDRNGDPISNATVRISGYNENKFSGTSEEINETIDDLQAELEHPEPDAWRNQDGTNIQLTGSNGHFAQQTRYVAAHRPGDWDIQGVQTLYGPSITVDAVDLTRPQKQFAVGQPVILSLWDTTKTGTFQDQADEDLLGRTTTGKIVVEQLAPSGGVKTRFVPETKPLVNIASIPANGGVKTHEAVVLDGLGPGFYNIHPKGEPTAGYVIVVGQPDQILQPYINNLKDRNQSLTERVQTLQDKKDSDKIVQTTVQANASGQFNASLNSSFDQVRIIAYRAPSGLNGSAVSRTDIVDYYDSLKLNDDGEIEATITLEDAEKSQYYSPNGTPDTYYATDGVTEARPPESNLTVDVVEVQAPPLTNTSAIQNLSTANRRQVLNETLSNLANRIQQNLDSVDRSKLEELYRQTDKLREQNEQLNEKYQKLLEKRVDDGGGGGDTNVKVEVNASNATDQQLIDRIESLETALAELQDTIQSQEPQVDKTQDTVSLRFPFDSELNPENVLVRVHYSNGTVRPLTTDSQYVSVATPPGNDEVVISELPLPNSSVALADIEVRVATENGLGSERATIRNPAFGGKVARLDAIRVSSLKPTVGDNVTVGVVPRDSATFGSLSAVTVTGPEGDVNTTSPSGKEVQFTADQGPGSYHIRVKYTNSNGTAFYESARIEVVETGGERPPSIMVSESPTGMTAIVGDGLQAGAIEFEENAGVLHVNARVNSSDQVPGVVHVYTQGADLPPDVDTVVRLQTESGQSINKQAGVVVHLQEHPTDSTFYRGEGDSQPLYLGQSNQYGTVANNGNQTLITTYTDDSGQVRLRTNADPSFVESINHELEGSLVGGFLVFMPGGVFAGLVVVVFRRRDQLEADVPGSEYAAPLVMVTLIVTASVSLGAAPAHAAPSVETVDAGAFDNKLTPAAAEVCGLFGCTTDDSQVSHGRTGEPVWYVWTDSASGLDDLESWANESDKRTVLSRDNGSQRARVAAPAADVLDAGLLDSSQSLIGLTYVAGVDVARLSAMPDQPGQKGAGQYSHPQDGLFTSVPSEGIAFSSDANASTLKEVRNVTDVDNVSVDGSGVTVAVLDASLNTPNASDDPLFGDRLVKCRETVGATSTAGCDNVSGSETHGHHVASTIAADAQNNSYDGIAPEADIVYAKVLNDDGQGDIQDIIEGLQWAENQGADLVAMSLGSSQYSAALAQEVREVVEQGNVTIVSVAAGNSRFRGGRANVASPADTPHPGVITVTATNVTTPDKAGVAWFANTGPDRGTDGSRGVTKGQRPDIAAPGMAITAPVYSSNDVRQNVTLSGTSMAQPVLIGNLALLLDAQPSLKNDTQAVRDRLRETAEPMPNAGVTETAWGMVDAERLINDNATDTSQADARNEPARQRDEANRAIGVGFFTLAAAPAERQQAAAAV